MNDNRFILQPYKGRATRHECPSCHRKQCFTRYIDTEGHITFPCDVGRCDHENNCGYHYTPKQFFHDHPEVKEQLFENAESVKVPKVPRTVKPKVEPYFFERNLMLATLRSYNSNPLCVYLQNVIGFDETVLLMRMYNTGTTKKGGTAYWQMDYRGRLRDCKIMFYDEETGHRLKDPQHHTNWLHSLMRIDKERIRQCFFGEHLLSLDSNEGKPIAIVESEKSAIIASAYLPQFVWIATGGKDGMFTQADLNLLRGRRVFLFPDLGMLDNWHEKAIMLIRHGIDATVYDFLEKNASEADKKAGLDIADFLLGSKPMKPEAEPTQEQTELEKMKDSNPAIGKLVDALNLEVVNLKYSEEGKTASALKEKSTDKGVADEKANAALTEIKATNETRWRGRNPECHACKLSHEGINGTYCDKLGRYVEYGRGDCGKDGSPSL